MQLTINLTDKQECQKAIQIMYSIHQGSIPSDDLTVPVDPPKKAKAKSRPAGMKENEPPPHTDADAPPEAMKPVPQEAVTKAEADAKEAAKATPKATPKATEDISVDLDAVADLASNYLKQVRADDPERFESQRTALITLLNDNFGVERVKQLKPKDAGAAYELINHFINA
jgi:hypothetical protein